MKIRIADLLPAPRKVSVGPNTALELRGLTLTEITKLLTKYQSLLVMFVDAGATKAETVIAQSPDMVAEIIALAADAEDQIDDVKKLPFAVQVEAVAAVWELSVPDVKKLIESLSRVAAALEEGNKPLRNLSLQNLEQTS